MTPRRTVRRHVRATLLSALIGGIALASLGAATTTFIILSIAGEASP